MGGIDSATDGDEVIRGVAGAQLRAMWSSPLPYLLGAAFHVVLGALGTSQVVGRGQAVFQPVVPIAGFLLIVMGPVLAVRAFVGDASSDPVGGVKAPAGRMVAGRYTAVLATLLIVLAPVVAFAVLLAAYGDPDPGPVTTGLLGLVLLGAAVAGVGMLASSMLRSLSVASLVATGVLLILWFVHMASETSPIGAVQAALSLSERLRSFAGGVLDLADVVYFVSLTLVALLGTVAAMHSRRRA